MKPSPVSLMDHDKGKPDTNWRTRYTFPHSVPGARLDDINQYGMRYGTRHTVWHGKRDSKVRYGKKR